MPDGKYQIIAGERRWRAVYKILKRPTIAALIRGSQSDVDAVMKQTVENLQREGLNPIDEARQYRRLADLKVTQAEIGRLSGGKSQPVIANTLKLLELPGEVQNMVASGELTAAHGLELVRFALHKKLCLTIAATAAKRKWTAKQLRDEALPFGGELAKAGLVEEICTYSYYNTSYTVPAELKGDSDFIWRDYTSFYILPATGAPNKWAPHKAKQDAARAAKKAKEEKREDSKQSKMSPADKARRQKTIAENKRNRAESAEQTEVAFAKLRALKAIDKAVLVVALSKVFADGHYANVLKEAANKIGIPMPKGLVSTSWYTTVSLKVLATMKELDMLRLAAAAIVMYHGEQAVKFAHAVPDEIEQIAGKPKKGAKPTSIEIVVSSTSHDNVARAGNVTVSCTSSASAAARKAGARYLGCSEADVNLETKSRGVFRAVRKGGK